MFKLTSLRKLKEVMRKIKIISAGIENKEVFFHLLAAE
jgi:hypothetical protein